MNTDRVYRLTLDLNDEERRQLAAAASHTDERFVDFVRRIALEGARNRVMENAWARGRIA